MKSSKDFKSVEELLDYIIEKRDSFNLTDNMGNERSDEDMLVSSINEVNIEQIAEDQLTLEHVTQILEKREGLGTETKKITLDIISELKAKRFINNSISSEDINSSLYSIKNYFREKFKMPVIEVSVDEKDENNLVIRLVNNKDLNSKCEVHNSWRPEEAKDTFAKKYGVMSEKIHEVSSLSEYIDLVSRMEELSEYVSRGQKDCSYELLPSLLRSERALKTTNTGSGIINAFRQKGIHYDCTINEMDTLSLAAYGQHHGLPTRFLDFTEAHLLSLLFAVEEYDYDITSSIVYLVNATGVNKENTNKEEKLLDLAHKLNKGSVIDNYDESLYFCKLENSNQRMHFQKGCFLKVPHVYEVQMKSMMKNHTTVVLVRPEYKRRIFNELYSMGITFESIYPDMDNLAKNIKFENIEGGIANE